MIMPTGTAVDNVYEALRKKGYSKEKAARIAQSETGEALATGRPPKHPVGAANTVLPPPPPPPPRRTGPSRATGISGPAYKSPMIGGRGNIPESVSRGIEADKYRNPTSAPPPPTRTPKAPAGQIAFANKEEDALMCGPSSARTSYDNDRLDELDRPSAPPAPESQGRLPTAEESLQYYKDQNFPPVPKMKGIKPSIAFANDDEAAQMIRPSSERVTLSPGNQILKDLYRKATATASSLPDPDTLPEFQAPATATKAKPRAPRKPKAAADGLDEGQRALKQAALDHEQAAELSGEGRRVYDSLIKQGRTHKAAFGAAKSWSKVLARGQDEEPAAVETQGFQQRMGKQIAAARGRHVAAPKIEPQTQPSEDAMPFSPSKFIASHPVYKERIAAGDTPEKAGVAANLATFADHPVYQEHIKRGATPEKAAEAAEADMVATARARGWNEKHRATRASEDAQMVQPSSMRTTSALVSEPEAPTLRAVTESPALDLREESEADHERMRERSRQRGPLGQRGF